MVSDVYRHIDDEVIRRTDQLLKEIYYRRQTGNADSFEKEDRFRSAAEESGVDVELLMKALENPETRRLLSVLIKQG